jgi:hypothetical protein
MDFLTIASMSGVPAEELAKIIGLVAFSSFLLLLFMGLTNKVIIFYDGKDLVNSLGIIVIPIISYLCLLYFKPENAPEDYDILWGSSSSTSVVIVAAGYVAYCAMMTYITAIKHNGFILGIVVGTFKVASALLITLFAVGWLNKMFGNQPKSLGTWIVMVLILGLFGWVVKKMVNGEAVMLKRLQVQQGLSL